MPTSLLCANASMAAWLGLIGLAATLVRLSSLPRYDSLILKKAVHPGNTHGSLSEMQLQGVRVLVVDDQPECRELLAEVFDIFGAETRTAPSVDAALQELKAFAPHVVVSDLEMPGKDGYRLLAEIRAEGVTVPVIAATGNPGGHRGRAEAAGFAGFLPKPSPIHAIAGAVLGVIQRSTL